MNPLTNKADDLNLTREEQIQKMRGRFIELYNTPFQWLSSPQTKTNTLESWQVNAHKERFGVYGDDILLVDTPPTQLIPSNTMLLAEMAGLAIRLIQDDKSIFQSKRQNENLFCQKFSDYTANMTDRSASHREMLLTKKICERAMHQNANHVEAYDAVSNRTTTLRFNRIQCFMGNTLENHNVAAVENGKAIAVHALFLSY